MRLSIKSIQEVDGQREHFSSEVDAVNKMLGDIFCIHYEEKLEGVLHPVKSIIKWDPNESQITLIRKGGIETKMEFQKGKKTRCMYCTSLGTLPLMIDTKNYIVSYDGATFSAELSYDIYCDNVLTSKNTLFMTMSE